MRSRYDFMSPGSVVDEVTGNVFPDPISFNYLSLRVSEAPQRLVMSESDPAYFWDVVNSVYGKPELDDMVLTLNGISHKNFLKSGDAVLFPSLNDILGSYSTIKNP